VRYVPQNEKTYRIDIELQDKLIFKHGTDLVTEISSLKVELRKFDKI